MPHVQEKHFTDRDTFPLIVQNYIRGHAGYVNLQKDIYGNAPSVFD